MFIAIDINKRFEFTISIYQKNILFGIGFIQIVFSPSWKTFREFMCNKENYNSVKK